MKPSRVVGYGLKCNPDSSCTPDPTGSTEGIPELVFFSKVDLARYASQSDCRRRRKQETREVPHNDADRRWHSTEDVLVKFTVKYNATTHRLLANHNPPNKASSGLKMLTVDRSSTLEVRDVACFR